MRGTEEAEQADGVFGVFGRRGEGEQDPKHKKHTPMGMFLVFGEPGTTKNVTVMLCFLC